MLATYTDNDGNLVVEFAVPGREAEHISIEATHGPGLVINVAPMENTPGSILASPMQYEVQRVAPAFSLEGVHAVCKHGLLTLTFPLCPPPVTQPKLEMREFMRRQRFHLN